MTSKTRRSKSSNTTSKKAKTAAPRGRRSRPQTKKQIAMALLEKPGGTSIAELRKALGWQPHSVRGFLAGTVRKMPGITLTSEKPDDGQRRYRVTPAAK